MIANSSLLTLYSFRASCWLAERLERGHWEGSERAPGWVLEGSEIPSGGPSDSSVRYEMTPGSPGQLKAGHGPFGLKFSNDFGASVNLDLRFPCFWALGRSRSTPVLPNRPEASKGGLPVGGILLNLSPGRGTFKEGI